MKILIAAILILVSIVGSAATRPQKELLMGYYDAQGDDLFFTLYWLPETSQTVQKYIPDHDYWSGFDSVRWKKITDDKKLNLLEELGAELDRMEGQRLERLWTRFRDWRRIHSQLLLLAEFLNHDGDFIDLAFSDPTLRPGFQWLLDSRGPGFDPKLISNTLAAGETVSVYPQLVEHLLDTPERQRLECFSRLFVQIAERKPNKAEQAGTEQPATRPESKSEGSDKPQPEAEGRSR